VAAKLEKKVQSLKFRVRSLVCDHSKYGLFYTKTPLDFGLFYTKTLLDFGLIATKTPLDFGRYYYGN
jgi:hypothetical protein